MTNINPNEILSAANLLSDALKQSEKFAIPLLAVRAKKAALNHPEDQTLRMLANVLNKMSENGKIFITRGEFNNVYSKFAGNKSFAQNYFADELNIDVEKPQRKLAGEKQEDFTLYRDADETMVNALSGMWDEKGKVNKVGECKQYNPNVAKQATAITNLELTRLGTNPKIVNTFGGTEQMIICDAIYETPLGEAHMLVPVEITRSGALIPNMFVSRHGFADLTKEAVNAHVIACAGKNFHVNSDALLNALSVAKQASTMTEFEIMALAAQEKVSDKRIKKEASDDNASPFLSTGSVLMQQIDTNKTENVMLQMPRADGMEKFASKLTSSKGVAEFMFGRDTIENGLNAVASKLTSFGYRPQISVAACDNDSITYAVAINAGGAPIGFEVVAEVSNKKPVIPAIVAVNDKAYDFTKEGISSLVRSNMTNYKMVAAVSPLYDLKSSELLGTIREAADIGNYKIAEEALTVLAEKANEETYKTALAEYMRSVHASGNPQLKKQASTQSKCSRIITASTHTGPMCGHLNLPLDKVCQNEHGECVPLYRKEMSDTYEGAFFSTSKILG